MKRRTSCKVYLLVRLETCWKYQTTLSRGEINLDPVVERLKKIGRLPASALFPLPSSATPSWPSAVVNDAMTQRRSPSKDVPCSIFIIPLLHYSTSHSTPRPLPSTCAPILINRQGTTQFLLAFLCSSRLLIVQFSNITLLHSNYVKLFAFNIIQQTWFVISKTKFPTPENAIISIPS